MTASREEPETTQTRAPEPPRPEILGVHMRGTYSDDPAMWQVTGTLAGDGEGPPAPVHVRLSFGEGALACQSDVITTLCRAPDDPVPGIAPEAGGTHWVATFEIANHRILGPLGRWLHNPLDEKTDRTLRVEAWTGDRTPAGTGAERAFHASEVPLLPPWEVGVLFVHGISPYRRSQALIDFGEPIVRFLEDWTRGYNRWSAGRFTPDQAAAFEDHVYETTLREREDLLGLTNEVQELRKSASADTSDLTPETAGIVVAAVRVEDTQVDDGRDADQAGSAHIRLSTLDGHGRMGEAHILLKEAWWTPRVVLPGRSELVSWIWRAFPVTIGDFLARFVARDVSARPVLGWIEKAALLLLSPVVLLGVTLLLLVLSALLSLMFLPIGPVKAIVGRVLTVLLGTVGQSYAFVSSSMRRRAITASVAGDLGWMSERCGSVMVLSHSQGAEVAREVLRSQRWDRVARWIFFGAGIKPLVALGRDENRRYGGVAIALAVLVGGMLAILGTAILAPDTTPGLEAFRAFWTRPEAWLSLYVVLLGVMIWVGLVIPPDVAFKARKSMLVNAVEIHATHDYVSNGSALTRADVTLLKAAGAMPDRREVWNRASFARDHTSYFRNIEEFVAPVAHWLVDLARDGTGLADFRTLHPDDPARLDEAVRVRRRMVPRLALRRLGMVAVLLWLVSMTLAPFLPVLVESVTDSVSQGALRLATIPADALAATLWVRLGAVTAMGAALYIDYRLVSCAPLLANAARLFDRTGTGSTRGPLAVRLAMGVVFAVALALWFGPGQVTVAGWIRLLTPGLW